MKLSAEEIDREVGRRIAARRLKGGYSQADLGRAVSRTFQQIQKYESGANRVSASVLVLIADFLQCSPGELLPAVRASVGLSAASPLNREGREIARLCEELDGTARKALLEVARALARSGGTPTGRPADGEAVGEVSVR